MTTEVTEATEVTNHLEMSIDSDSEQQSCFVIDEDTIEDFDPSKCKEEPKSHFDIEKLPLDELFTDPKTAIDKTIEDVMLMMFETFDKDPEEPVRESELLPTHNDVETRLAELGFDRNFFLYKNEKGLEYRSHEFDINC